MQFEEKCIPLFVNILRKHQIFKEYFSKKEYLNNSLEFKYSNKFLTSSLGLGSCLFAKDTVVVSRNFCEIQE